MTTIDNPKTFGPFRMLPGAGIHEEADPTGKPNERGFYPPVTRTPDSAPFISFSDLAAKHPEKFVKA